MSLLKYTAPVAKRYTPLKSPPLVWWAKVPPVAKYSGSVVSAALALTHIHPNTLGTLAPPLLVGAFFAARKLEHRQYVRLLALARSGTATWRIRNYDETSLENVKLGIDSEYLHFGAQVQEKIESLVVDHLVLVQQNVPGWAHAILDENKQVLFHLGGPETFVTLKADTDSGVAQFITLSLPYSLGVHKRRLGVVQVSMLEKERGGDYVDYEVAVQLWPYKFFSKPIKLE